MFERLNVKNDILSLNHLEIYSEIQKFRNLVIYLMVIGHRKQLQLLEQAWVSGKLGHAYLLAGPAKVGKKTIALEWLSRIMDAPLGENTAHPDFLFVKPLIDEKTGKAAAEITVGQIRGLIWKLSLKPVMGRFKAAVIDEAHLMNAEAQNALLKTLEEPPGDAIIVLVAQNSRRLLDTIRSRCEILQFNFVTDQEMQNWQRSHPCQLDPEAQKEIVKLSFGRPGRLMEFAADKNAIKKWQADEKEFSRVIGGDLADKFNYAKKITDDDTVDLGELVEIWQFYFRSKLLESLKLNFAGVGNLRTSQVSDSCEVGMPRFEFSKSKAGGYTPEKISEILKKILDLNVILQTTNASPRLAIEIFMMSLCL